MYVKHNTTSMTEKPTTQPNHTDTQMQNLIAQWYRTAQTPDTSTIQRAYDVIAQINDVWYDMTPVDVKHVQYDPYDDYSQMRDETDCLGFLQVFAGGSRPKHMTHIDNVKGRVVHDWFGHLEADCDFSLSGEFTKFEHVKHRYPEWVRPLLFGEIVGQRALAGHLTGGFTDRLFRQKAVFAPDSLVDLCVEQLTYDKEQTMRHST